VSGGRFPRSRFLEGATLGLGGVIGGLVTVPAIGFMIVPAFKGQGYPKVDLGPLENFTEGKWFVTKFFMHPDAGEVSHRTAYIRNNGTLNGEPSFTIISNRCAHLGCPVQPNGPVQDNQTKNIDLQQGQKVTMIPASPCRRLWLSVPWRPVRPGGQSRIGALRFALSIATSSRSSTATSSSASRTASRT